MSEPISIRNAMISDLDSVIALDHVSTSEAKPDYWRGIFAHYVNGSGKNRHFLVAEFSGVVIGFIVGEVRAWEFGSPPCGWVFALTVSRESREKHIGMRLFDEMSVRLKQAGVSTVRTMVDLDNKQTMSFFRSMGLRTGRYVELEMQLS